MGLPTGQGETPRRGPPAIGLAAAAIVFVTAGVTLGLLLTRPSAVDSLTARGHLMEVHLATGVILVGRFEGSSDGFLHLSLAATITTSGSTPETAQNVVELLSLDPYDLAGDILIAHQQVLLAGPVAAGSALENAYRQALGEPAPTGKPSP